MENSRRVTKKSAALILGAVVCTMAAFFAVAYDSLETGSKSRAFDSSAWKSASVDCMSRARLEMLPDLLRAHSFIGMERKEVVALLGEPDREVSGIDACMYYILGPETGFISMDYVVFMISLKDGRVVSAVGPVPS